MTTSDEMQSRTHLMLAPMALFAACQGDPQPTTGIPVQVDDSAGVRIVEYAGTPVVDAPFRFTAEPLYRHGANPDDYASRRIDAGRLFPDGSAVVSDGGNDELVVLSRDGETHELLAGPGEGPGDISYVSAVFVLGQDTVLAADRELLRATVFAGGSVARTVDTRHLRGLGVQGTSASGQLLMARDGFRSGFEEEWLPGHMATFDMDTGTLDTVAAYDFVSRPRGPAIQPDRGVRPGDRRGRPVRLHQIRPAGGHLAPTRRHSHTNRTLAGRTGTPDGGVAARYRGGNPGTLPCGQPRRVGGRHRRHDSRGHGHLLGQYRRTHATIRPSIRRRGGSRMAASLPPGRAREAAPEHTVISADGEWLGRVEAPLGFRILDVAGGLVLGVLRDELDVQIVAVYELVAG